MRKTGLISIAMILTIMITGLRADPRRWTWSHGAIIRGDSTQKKIALVFTGGDFYDGAEHIWRFLKIEQEGMLASFFFTGDFYRNPATQKIIRKLVQDGHYMGAHSDKHLLYCDWKKRDSLLVTREQFVADLEANYTEMKRFGITREQTPFFMPPYEWYNQTIARWTKEMGLTLINFTPGTLSNADYTFPDLDNYKNNRQIIESILRYAENKKNGLNGFILLLHVGATPLRPEKVYYELDIIVENLKVMGYQFVRIDQLLAPAVPGKSK